MLIFRGVYQEKVTKHAATKRFLPGIVTSWISTRFSWGSLLGINLHLPLLLGEHPNTHVYMNMNTYIYHISNIYIYKVIYLNTGKGDNLKDMFNFSFANLS